MRSLKDRLMRRFLYEVGNHSFSSFYSSKSEKKKKEYIFRPSSLLRFKPRNREFYLYHHLSFVSFLIIIFILVIVHHHRGRENFWKDQACP